jgi:rRNA maturation endonuclease Nob1
MGNTFTRKKKKVKFKLTPDQIKEYITDDGAIDMSKLRDEYDGKNENKKKTPIKKTKKKPKKIMEEIVVLQDDDNIEVTEKQENKESEENLENEEEEFEVEQEDIELITEEPDKSEEHVRISKPAFDTLVEALYDSGVKASRNVQVSNLYHLDWYFENFKDTLETKNNDVEEILEEQNKILSENVLQPRMVKIRVPSDDPNSTEKWRVVEIPLFTLVKHNSLKIDTMDIELKFNMGKIIKKTELKKNKFHSISGKKGKALTKKKWKIRIATPVRDNSNFATLKIKFTYDSPLESMTRLTERYDRFL